MTQYSEADQKLVDKLREVAEILGAAFTIEGNGMGFLLLAFGNKSMHFVSNVAREDSIAAMTELTRRWKAGDKGDPLVGTEGEHQ